MKSVAKDLLMLVLVLAIAAPLAAEDKKSASLEESVGEFWFGEGAEVVVEGDFVGFLGAKSV